MDSPGPVLIASHAGDRVVGHRRRPGRGVRLWCSDRPLGYLVVGIFLMSWFVSALVYRMKGYDRIEVTGA